MQAPVESLADRHLDLLRLGSSLQGVDDAPLRRGNHNAMDGRDLGAARRLFDGMEANARAGALASLRARDRDMDDSGDHVGQVIELKGALVRHNRPSALNVGR